MAFLRLGKPIVTYHEFIIPSKCVPFQCLSLLLFNVISPLESAFEKLIAMIPANLPSNEQTRIQELLKYDILDTEAEQMFDEITRLASQICETPIALISLVDSDRQWFKSKVGLDAQETPRELAFCAHAIHDTGIFEVPNALDDKRFFDNPLVDGDPNIRFYAGQPLITPSGYALGTLCAIDRVPKTLTAHQRFALEVLSHQVVNQLELRLKLKKEQIDNQNKSDYISYISHEIRNPLNSIYNLTSNLTHNEATLGAQKKDQLINIIHDAASRILTLVNSVLDFNKIESGATTLNLSSFSVSAVLNQIQNMFEGLAQDKAITLKFMLPQSEYDWVYYDELKIYQVITNLVSNAIKFTESDKTITVCCEKKSDRLIISVKDEGRGISPEQQTLLFEKFCQLKSTDELAGSGLGLCICKSFIELMDGELKLTSSLGQGSTFAIDLPYQAGKKEAAPQEASPTVTHDAHVLLVEDNEINQLIATSFLEDKGFNVVIANSAEEAMDLVESQSFSLVLMDYRLPGMDGAQAARKIRDTKPNLTIIGLTADTFSMNEDDKKAFDDIELKPYDIDSLSNKINFHLAS